MRDSLTDAPMQVCDSARWPDFLEFLLWLRTSVSSSLPVRWALHDPGDLTESDIALFEHLPPPTAGGDELSRLWRSTYRYGRLHCRQGPGFVNVKDRRSQFRPALFTLRGTRASQLMADEILPASQDRRLQDVGLVIEREGRQLFLPARLKYPPIRAFAV